MSEATETAKRSEYDEYDTAKAGEAMEVIGANLLKEGQTSRGRWCTVAAGEIERQTAEIRRLQEAKVAINTWGVQLFDDMGKFMKEATESNGPLSVKILCDFSDNKAHPILHLWASTDGQSPEARNAELRQQLRNRDLQISAITTELEQLKAAALAASGDGEKP